MESKNKGGRPREVSDQKLQAVVELVKQGMTYLEISKALNLSVNTIKAYMSRNEKFALQIQVARYHLDQKVEKALFKRATGYSHPEEKVFVSKDGLVTRVETTKHYPPDTQAASFWLRNRQADRWKDTTEVNHSVENVHVHIALPSNQREIDVTPAIDASKPQLSLPSSVTTDEDE